MRRALRSIDSLIPWELPAWLVSGGVAFVAIMVAMPESPVDWAASFAFTNAFLVFRWHYQDRRGTEPAG